ncbi:MAG: hypothetical protein QOJ19_1435, partial [Acidimicrobiia bacterium]|nr:hypothetical protein [Acidimicrobiia bacterium]
MTAPDAGTIGTTGDNHRSPGRHSGPPTARAHRWPLKAYMALIVAVSMMVAAAGAIFVRRASINNARRSAVSEAQFGAGLAARAVASDIELLRTTVGATAANPAISHVFENSTGCTLTFGGGDAFESGHIDVVDSGGAVRCTSLQSPEDVGYGNSPWLSRALEHPVVEGPVTDPRTGRLVLVVAAPVPGRGIVVSFADLNSLGSALSDHFGGPHNLEYIVTSADQRTILTRSVDSVRWVGKPTTNTSFAPDRRGTPTRDVDGKSRLYGNADVPGIGWATWAGADASDAVTAARRLAQQEAAIVLV